MKKLAFIALIILASCTKEKDPDDNFHAADEYNRTIKIHAAHVYDVAVGADSSLPDVTVEIYSSRLNFMDTLAPDAVRTTDSAGEAIFENRNEEYYWIIARHDALGIISDSVSTPASTISFVELLFY